MAHLSLGINQQGVHATCCKTLDAIGEALMQSRTSDLVKNIGAKT